jgi:uncharacterized Zn-binding protein involved in type VI secretion
VLGGAGVTLAAALSLLGTALAFTNAPPVSPGAVVRRAPEINGNGKVVGSVRQVLAEGDTELIGEDVSLTGGATITGDLLVPGAPTLLTSGKPTFGGLFAGAGSSLPSNYNVRLAGNVALGRLVTRTDPIPLAAVPAPPPAPGTRDLSISAAGQSAGDFSTLRDLTLGGGAGEVAVPPGTYRRFAADGAVAFVMGEAGATRPSVYNLDELSLDHGASLRLAGPVRLNVAKTVSLANGSKAGSQADALLLSLNVAAAGATGDAVLLSGGSSLGAVVRAPSGRVSLRGNAALAGTVFCDRLTVNGGSVLQGVGDSTPPSLAVSEPADGSATKLKQLLIRGTVSDQTETVVTVNGVAAAVDGDAFSAAVTLVEGTNTLRVAATDLFGNQAERTLGVKVDTTPPAINVLSPTEGLITNQARITVSGTFEDASDTTVRINGVPAALVGGNFSVTVELNEGRNDLLVQAADAAGNQTEARGSVTRDTAPPALTLLLPSEGQVAQAIDVSGRVEDATAVTVQANGVDLPADGGAFVGRIPHAEGGNPVRVVATDAAGNVAEITRNVTVDTTPPVISDLSPAEGALVAAGAVTIRGRVTDATAVGVLLNDRRAAVAAGGLFTAEGFTVVPDENQIIITARDAAGNFASKELLLRGQDMTPPPAVVLFPVNSPTRLDSQLVEGKAPSGSRVMIAGGVEPVVAETAFGTGLFAAPVKLAPGANALTATAVGENGVNSPPVQFLIESVPDAPRPPAGQAAQINVSTGDTQRTLAGLELPSPLIALVTDAGGHPTQGVAVRFTVVQGGGAFAGAGAPTAEATTDEHGYARARYVAGTAPGIQLVRADFAGNMLAPVTFSAEVLERYEGSETTVSGTVLDQNLRALPNVLVRLGGQQVRTGADGRFVIENPPTGPHHVLELIGRDQITLPGRWPNISYELDVLPGVDNDLGRPLFLPKVNDGVAMPLDADNVVTQDTVFELPVKGGEPPVRLVARAGTRVTFPPDVTDKRLSVTRIPNDRIPMQLEDGRATNLYVSVQPSGAIFEPALEISFPNLDGGAPGSEVLLMSFDHDAGRYVRVGTGHVSADGRTVTSDAGSGIRVGAWHAGPPPEPQPEVTVLGYIQIEGNPAFEDKVIGEDEVWLRGERAVKTTEPDSNAPRWDYRVTVALEENAGTAKLSANVFPITAKIEAQVIDHDDPARQGYTTLDKGKPVYGGSESSTSDFLKLRLSFEDQENAEVKSIEWSVKGSASAPYRPPQPSPSASEWDVGRLANLAGGMRVVVVIRFANGSTYPVIRDFKVGLRTDDIIVVGWIDEDNVPLPGGAQEFITRIMPPTGRSNNPRTCNSFIASLSEGDTDPLGTSLTMADRSYILHWMFKFAGNQDPKRVIPGGDFRDASGTRLDPAKVGGFLADPTNYKLFNRLQAKFEIGPSGFTNTKIIRRAPGGIGLTKNPCQEAFLGQAGAFFPGQDGPYNKAMSVTGSRISAVNDGSPDEGAIRVFNVLMGKDLPPGRPPLFWENIGSSITLTPGAGGRISSVIDAQPYPTYYTYVNGRLVNTQLQAPSPSQHFYPNPYPFGTVHCTTLFGITPGGRCGFAQLPEHPSARIPAFIRAALK